MVHPSANISIEGSGAFLLPWQEENFSNLTCDTCKDPALRIASPILHLSTSENTKDKSTHSLDHFL